MSVLFQTKGEVIVNQMPIFLFQTVSGLFQTVGSYFLYILNMHANFHVNWILFTIWSIDSSFIRNFKLQKLEFK